MILRIRKKYFFLLLLFLAKIASLQAQQNFTLHSMNSIVQSLYVNPSNFPLNNINIGLPGISSTYFGVTNTAFRYHDLIYKRPDDSLTFDMNKAISKMSDNNYLMLSAQTDLLTVGFRVKKNYFNITATEKFIGIANYSKGLVDFLWNGNGPQIGKTIDIGIGLQYTHYREYGINYVRQITSKLTAGAKLKYLYGMENTQTVRANASLYTEPTDFTLKTQTDILINQSGGFKQLTSDTFNLKQYAFGLNNKGFGLDLGATYKISDKISVNASLIDFGGINWKSDVRNYTTNNPNSVYTFKGIYINELINDTTSLNEAFNKTLDSAYASFKIDTTKNSYRTRLNRQVYIGGTYNLNEQFQTNLLLHGFFIDGKMRPGVSASIGGKFGKLIHMNLSYSIFNKSYTNVGWGISFNTRAGTQFYLVSDNVIGAIFPQNAKSLNIRIGMNLRFGKDPFLDDEDQDGVPDGEDKCPKLKGSTLLKGCPDRDNDGVADVEDQCPDDYGLPRFKGCPDKDGDGVIDKFDKCPDVPGTQRFQGCPDRDDDGVRDDQDECPDEKGLMELKGCPDADGDGVTDKKDKCPNDFGSKENDGCPKDSDNDGVFDTEDLCPNEAGNKANKGCPDKDSDGDGIIDREDECPQTKGSAANKGCPVILPEENVIITDASSNLKFENGKDELLSTSYVHLDNLVQMMKSNVTIGLDFAVHTDNSTSESFAMTLTKDRATVLQEYFTRKNIDVNRLKIIPYGSTKPVGDNNSDDGRNKNNRVDIEIFFK